jgi:hypothetical protein
VRQNPGTRNHDAEPGTLSSERDTNKAATYVRVMVLETAILIALWLFGRAFS